MNSIEWKYGAVCYASGEQWFASGDLLFNHDDSEVGFALDFIGCVDFKLNEPRIDDYLPKSELDTEQKYNDAVEVFGLFGFGEFIDNSGFKHINVFKGLGVGLDGEVMNADSSKRKLTYNQLMAIGKLKRLIDELEAVKRQSEDYRCVKVDLSNTKTIESSAGGFSVEYECVDEDINTHPKINHCDVNQTECVIDEFDDEAFSRAMERVEELQSTNGAGQKHDQSKPRFSLIPLAPLQDVIAVLEFGARKYGTDNWKHVENPKQRYLDAFMRHTMAYMSGELIDPESGLPHLAHAQCCLLFLQHFDK